MEPETIHVTNQEGVSYDIPSRFIGKETHVGDKYISYQLLRLKKSGLFSIDELYSIASLIEERQPNSLISWKETFLLLESDSRSVFRKLKALHLG